MPATASPDQAGTFVDADLLLRLGHVVRHLPDPSLAASGRPGGFPSRRRGNGLDVRDVRLYADGDDFRHVDAMTTARTGRVHVRNFHDDRDRTAMLIADFRPPMLWGTRRRFRSVAAAEALAMSGWRVIGAGGRVGLMVAGAADMAYVAPRARDRAMAQVAGALAQAHEQASEARSASCPPLDEQLERAARLAPTGASLVIATGLDHPGPDLDAVLQGLARRFDVTVLLITDRLERSGQAGAYAYYGEDNATHWTRLGASIGTLPDPRPARLRALGVTVRRIDASADAADIGRALEEEVADGL
ncbi:hypothetical protein HDIA_1036 [Hartmannibacter diazotrophicus]|uniref:DUF58 domain-containing protein n=1 Tax=Hartmannibacter diazotrophicus TaxID=1482074 RepID=A0A2C9D2L5_9HYPH|nr:DUF58 domain-containing protein [Hartmannibacter diazotrophicus]SON54577.1 hypothetical protein HDIA_1036 [Hartmannibacter diazotrophicus]